MPTDPSLFGLFGDFRASWPADRFRQTAALNAGDVSFWLGDLDLAVKLRDVRTSANADRVSIEARYWIDLNAIGSTDGIPFVITTMPDVEFRVQGLTTGNAGWLFVSLTDAGADVLIEGLPVEIRLPAGLVQLHPADENVGPPFEKSRGTFSAGTLDHQRVVLRRNGQTSIFTHLRVRITPDNHVELSTPSVISFSRCLFLGLPALAVHDFRLLPSPHLARETEEWVRHGLERFGGTPGEPTDSCFAFRGLHLDPSRPPVSDVVEWASGNAERRDVAQLVLDDVVLPLSIMGWPIPRHLTVGIRRNLLTPYDELAVFEFDEAPVQLNFCRDPKARLVIDRFFFKSKPPAPPGEPLDPGLTFAAAIVFGDVREPNKAITIGVGENFTPRIGYRRELDVTGLVEDGTEFNLLKFRLFGTTIEIMGLTVGYSIGRALGEDAGFGDCFELFGDLYVTAEPGDPDATFKLRSLQDEELQFAIEGLGWRQGSFSLEGARAPDGVVMMIGPVGFIFTELGLISENGATYFSFSGGLLIAPPGGTSGGVAVKRLRFRIAGSSDAPFFKLDGFFGFFQSDTVYIEAGGYFTDETVANVRRREFGFTGTVLFKLGGAEYGLSIDFITGEIKAADEQFTYFMFQLVLSVLVPVWALEVRGLRLLFANDMIPRLSPANLSVAQTRYFSWYRSSDPLTVSGDRRLDAWQPEAASWAVGLGVTCSVTGFGEIGQLRGFVMGLASPVESGVLVVLELFVIASKKPNAWAVVEIDIQNDRFAVLFGVEAKLGDFFGGDAPAWLDVATVKGTLVFGNKPGTVALGRIRDQASWLSLTIEFDVDIFRAFVKMAICFERVDGQVFGAGLVARFEGSAPPNVISLSFYVGLGIVRATFCTGSIDSSFAVFIEGAFRIVIFGFLRFGIYGGLHYKAVAYQPTRKELVGEITLETPWFLPDVTVRWEWTDGEVDPPALAAFTAPLQAASAYAELTGTSTGIGSGRTVRLHEELWEARQFDPVTGEEIARGTHSLDEFAAHSVAEGPRVQRFVENAALAPVSIDSTIAIEFTALVDDALGVGAVPAQQGRQTSGDLDLRYELVGLRVRRRPRFVANAPWTAIEDRQALTMDFDAPGGPALTGSFGPHELSTFWNQDVQTAAGTATKKLLINATTPYDFVIRNPEVDERTVRDHPYWPCCEPTPGLAQQQHTLNFRAEIAGIDLQGFRVFSESESRLRGVAPAVIRPHILGTLPVGVVVAGVDVLQPGVLFAADLDRPGIFCSVRLATYTSRVPADLVLIAYDDEAEEVGRTTSTLPSSFADFRNINLTATRPFVRFELMARRPIPAPLTQAPPIGGPVVIDPDAPVGVLPAEQVYIEVDAFTYYTMDEFLRVVRDAARCSADDDFTRDWSGRGKLFFLPNHQYEIETTVRLAIGHPSVETAQADVQEYVYFHTKGLPGLNAQTRVGEEVERYVRSVYSGGHGLVYREEPVAIVFNEDFHVAVPVALRPQGTIDERHQLFEMALTARPVIAADAGTVFSTTTGDWIVAHRSSMAAEAEPAWDPVVTASEAGTTRAVSAQPGRQRLSGVTQRDGARCALPNPIDVIEPTLIARPQGSPDPLQPGAELWRAATSFVGSVQQKDAPFVDRTRFDAADMSAFDFQHDPPGGGQDAWSVVDGELRVAHAALQFACFGEASWNHLRATAVVRPGSSIGGLALALPGGQPSRGLFVWIQQGEAAPELAVYRRLANGELTSMATQPLPDAQEWMAIRVSGFDDKLRIEVGDVSVEVDRGELREGQLALVGQGDVRFRSLQVEGLKIYSFPFTVSRYRSFADHIGSFDGRLASIAPDALGPGAATRSVASLWTDTRIRVAEAMQPGAPPTARQELFGEWSDGLGLPLTQEVERLLVSRLTSGASTAAFLLESPEPMDFTEEIDVTLEHRVRQLDAPLAGARLDALLEELLQLITENPRVGASRTVGSSRDRSVARAAASGSSRERRAALATEMARLDRLAARMELASTTTGTRVLGRAPAQPRPSNKPGLLEIDGMAGGKLTARVQEAATVDPAQRLRKGDRVLLGEVRADGEPRTLRVRRWAGLVEASKAGVYSVSARDDGALSLKTPTAAGLTADERARLTGLLVAVDPTRGRVIAISQNWVWENVDVRVLQDETARRAILVPVDGGANARTLTADRFRLRFDMMRQRWQTTDPPDADNHYQSSHTLMLVR